MSDMAVSPKSILSMFRPEDDMARRRGKQKGTLRKEGNSWIGYWNEEIRLVDGSTRWHKFSKKIADGAEPDPATRRMRQVTEKEAYRRFDEMILSKLDVMNTNPQSLATLREFVDRKFIPTLVLKKRKGQEHYNGMLKKHILPALGDKRLRDIRHEDVQTLILSKLATGYSSQTVTHIRNVISTLFKKAKAIGWYVGDPPTLGLEMPELIHDRDPRVALTAAELQKLLENLPPLMYTMTLTYVMTGLRRGELAGMRWKHANLTSEAVVVDGEVIQPFAYSVRESYVWVWGKDLSPEQRGGRYQSLKSDNGRRVIPLSAVLVDALLLHRQNSQFNSPDDAIFCGRTQKPLDMHNYLEDHFKPVVKKLGLPDISWHDLRHTNSTLSELHGATVTNRRKILGHGDDRMANHYSHEDIQQAREALQRVESSILPRPKLLRVK